MKKINLLLPVILLILGISGFNQTYAASNTPQSEACAGVGLVDGSSCGDHGTQLSSVLDVIVNLLSVIVGIAAVIMVIIAGLRFTTSGGNPQSVAGARSALLYALVGLIIVALAQILVHFVLGRASV